MMIEFALEASTSLEPISQSRYYSLLQKCFLNLPACFQHIKFVLSRDANSVRITFRPLTSALHLPLGSNGCLVRFILNFPINIIQSRFGFRSNYEPFTVDENFKLALLSSNEIKNIEPRFVLTCNFISI